jgi:hypothetical protein
MHMLYCTCVGSGFIYTPTHIIINIRCKYTHTCIYILYMYMNIAMLYTDLQNSLQCSHTKLTLTQSVVPLNKHAHRCKTLKMHFWNYISRKWVKSAQQEISTGSEVIPCTPAYSMALHATLTPCIYIILSTPSQCLCTISIHCSLLHVRYTTGSVWVFRADVEVKREQHY